MKKIIFLLLIALCANVAWGQTTFSLAIDVDTTVNESNNAPCIVADQTGIIVASLDFCHGGSCTDYIKIDLNGNLNWIKSSNNFPEFKVFKGSLIKLNNGGYAVNATYSSPDGFIGETAILNIDTNFDNYDAFSLVQDPFTFTQSGLRQISDTSYTSLYTQETTSTANNYEGVLVQVGTDGSIIEELHLDYLEYGSPIAYDTCANGYFLGEEVWEEFVMGSDQYALIRRTDLQGVPIWATQLNHTDHFNSYMQVRTMKNGNVAVAWATQDTVLFNPYLFTYQTVYCLDGNTGDVLWQVIFPEEFRKELNAIRIAENGDIIGGGTVQAIDMENYETGGWLFRISPQGTLLWERLYHTPAPSLGAWTDEFYIFDLTETPDGGIAATGLKWHQNPQNEWEDDVWILKVDANGCLTPNCTDYLIDVAAFEAGVGTDISAPLAVQEGILSISPNPAHAVLQVAYRAPTLPQAATLSFYNVLGHLVLQVPFAPNERNKTISVSNLAAGVYVCRMVGERGALLGQAKVLLR
jgi:hypothetical protein